MGPELQTVFDDAWRALTAATVQRTPFTLGYLGTTGLDGTPQVRAVILRRAETDAGIVYFATRADSAKIVELRREARVALTFYDCQAHVQLRLTGRAEVVTDPDERGAVWDSLGEHGRDLYRSPVPPGTPIRQEQTGEAELVGSDETDGFERFAWVRIHVDALDRLDLSSPAHARQRFARTPDRWSGEIIAR